MVWHRCLASSHSFGYNRRQSLGVALLLFFAFIVSLLISSFHTTSISALTTVPTKMNFQGRLTDASGNIKPNGTYNMKLRLYTVSSGGSSVWSEDRLVSAAQGVTVTNGLFSIKLGDISSLSASLFASGPLYLEVELPTPATATSSSPTWTEGAMTPRNQMATSAYAYNAETLDGLDSAAFGQLSGNNMWTGDNTYQTTSASALQVQNAAGINILSIDTTGESGNTISNGSVEIDATGWSGLGSATATRTTSTSQYGSASVQVSTTTSANDGAKYAVTLSDSTQYTASFYAKLSTGTLTAMAVGYSNDGTTGGETNCKTGVTVLTGGWTQVNCTFTTPASHSGSPYFYMKQQFGGTARTFYVDGLHMVTGSNIGAYYDGQVRNSVIFNHVAVQGGEDSNTAFQVQAANGTSVLAVDTLNKRIGIGTNSPNSRLHVGTITSSSIGLIVKGVNSQSGNLAEFQDNSNNVVASIGPTGSIYSKGTLTVQTNSDSAVLIQNAAGSSTLFEIDTNNSEITLGTVTNGAVFSSTGFAYTGTARATRTVSLIPEYSGSTFTPISANFNGSLSSDFCSSSSILNVNTTICNNTSDEHNYYSWTTTQASAQDYGIFVRYKVPSDYDTGSMTNLKYWGRGTTSSEVAGLTMYKGATACTTVSDIVTSATTWTESTTASPLGACTINADDIITFKVSLTATQNNAVQVGGISFTYRSKF